MTDIKFIGFSTGSYAMFKKWGNIKTYNRFSESWIEPFAYRNIAVYMQMETQYLTTGKELYLEYKRIFSSVNDGYILLGYYKDSPEDTVGYLFSSEPIVIMNSLHEPSYSPPSWFELKAFY